MFVIGLTGGTGSGKTTVLEYVRSIGGFIIDCDEVYHELLLTSLEMKAEINAMFPGVIVDGVLDRKKLGAHVFSNAAALENLSAITDKHVKIEVLRLIEEKKAEGFKIVAIDAIRLIESGLADCCDTVVGITAPEEIRLQRIIKREGITEEYASSRIKAQKSDAYFKENCNYIIENAFDTKEALYSYCEKMFEKIFSEVKN